MSNKNKELKVITDDCILNFRLKGSLPGDSMTRDMAILAASEPFDRPVSSIVVDEVLGVAFAVSFLGDLEDISLNYFNAVRGM